MNGAASFLLIAVVISVLGSLAIWAFNRKPKTFMSSIDDFQREMKALGREPGIPSAHRWRAGTRPRHQHDEDTEDTEEAAEGNDDAAQESRP